MAHETLVLLQVRTLLFPLVLDSHADVTTSPNKYWDSVPRKLSPD